MAAAAAARRARLQDKQFPVLLAGSRYADRLPIGTPEVLQNFKHERLSQFYKDWYRPDLMAVVAVGDFDVKDVEALIKKHFASIPRRRRRGVRVRRIRCRDRAGTSYVIASDAELTSTSVQVYNTMPARDQTTIGAYRQMMLVDRLFTGMLNARLSEIAQKPGAPFLGAGTGIGRLVRTKEASMLSAAVRENGVEAGLDAIFTEAERVAKFGFTDPELDRQKVNMLRGVRAGDGREGEPAVGRPRGRVHPQLHHRRADSGHRVRVRALQAFRPDDHAGRGERVARTWSPDRNRIVLVSAPQKPGLVLPTEAKLAARHDVVGGDDADGLRGHGQPRAAADDGADVRAAWSRRRRKTRSASPSGSSRTASASCSSRPRSGRTKCSCRRSARAARRSRAMRISFPRKRPPRWSGAGGLGTFSAVDLRKVLTGKVASAGASIGDYYEEINGTASPKDLETLFQTDLSAVHAAARRPDDVHAS